MATYQTVTDQDRIDVAPDLARCHASLRAAATLCAAGLGADGLTRAHQACVHAERALLATEKRSPQDAHGVHRMATLHFLQTNEFPREHLLAVERLQALRGRADDLPVATITADDASHGLEDAAAFVAAVESWLRSHGFLGAAS